MQLLGVAEARLLEPVALTLAALGVERALVVHGGGLDEVALHGETEAVRLTDGADRAADASRPRMPASNGRRSPRCAAAGPRRMRERLKALLMGYGTSAERRAVALNAGALLMTAGKAETLKEGVELALQRDRLGRGAARAERPGRDQQWLTGVLGAIVARKRADVAARLGGPVWKPARAGGADAGAACARRWRGRARASSWR